MISIISRDELLAYKYAPPLDELFDTSPEAKFFEAFGHIASNCPDCISEKSEEVNRT